MIYSTYEREKSYEWKSQELDRQSVQQYEDHVYEDRVDDRVHEDRVEKVNPCEGRKRRGLKSLLFGSKPEPQKYRGVK